MERSGHSIYEKMISEEHTQSVGQQLLDKLQTRLYVHVHIPLLESFENSAIFFNPDSQKVSILARRCYRDIDISVIENIEAIQKALLAIFPKTSQYHKLIDDSTERFKIEKEGLLDRQAHDYKMNRPNRLQYGEAKEILIEYMKILKNTIT